MEGSIPLYSSILLVTTPGPSLISVPRPAILVAMVTAPGCPAKAIISASL